MQVWFSSGPVRAISDGAAKTLAGVMCACQPHAFLDQHLLSSRPLSPIIAHTTSPIALGPLLLASHPTNVPFSPLLRPPHPSSPPIVPSCFLSLLLPCFQVMGLLQGKVQNDTFVVIDSFALPVEGTETRVNAQAEAYEYMVDFQGTSKVGCGVVWGAVG